MQNNNEFKGYSLFNDLEDKDLQVHNRARILINIMEDHAVGRNVNGTGALLAYGYFASIPEAERADVHTKFAELLAKKKEL